MDGVPGLGQHTRDILDELGISGEEQARLVSTGVV
jgi:itaconate CoA-transferase